MLRLCRARGSAPLRGRLRRGFDRSRAASRVIPLPATAPTAAKPRLLIGRHRGRMNGFINQGVRKMIIGLLNQNDQNALVGNLPSINLRDVSFEPIAKKGNGPDFRVTIEGVCATWVL
jgi:hypothetical protein